MLSEFLRWLLTALSQNGLIWQSGKLVSARRLPLLVKHRHSRPQHWKLPEEPRRGQHRPRNCRSGPSSKLPPARLQPGIPSVGKSSSPQQGWQLFPPTAGNHPCKASKHSGPRTLHPCCCSQPGCVGQAPASTLRAERPPCQHPPWHMWASYGVGETLLPFLRPSIL